MSQRPPPWFWNTAVLARLVWLLLAMVFVVYAGRLLSTVAISEALAHLGW
jgi:hypothetical protein